MTFKQFILAIVSPTPRRIWVHDNIGGFYLWPTIGFGYSNHNTWRGPQAHIMIVAFLWTIEYRYFDAAYYIPPE